MGVPRFTVALLLTIGAVMVVSTDVAAKVVHPGEAAGLRPLAPEPEAFKTGDVAQRVDQARAFDTVSKTKSLTGGALFQNQCSPPSNCPFSVCPPSVPKTVYYYYLGYYNTNYPNGAMTPDGGRAYWCNPWYDCPTCYRCYVRKQLTVLVPRFCWNAFTLAGPRS